MKLKSFTIAVLVSASILLWGSMSLSALAQTNVPTCTDCNLGYTQLEPIPGIALTSGSNPNDPNSLINPNNLYKIIDAIFTILITGGALMAVLSLTVGGVQYMTSSSAGGKNSGIKRAQAAMWAMLLIAGTWLILHTINPNLLSFNLNPCPNGGSGCTVNSNASNSGDSLPAGPTQTLSPAETSQVLSTVAQTPQNCAEMQQLVNNHNTITQTFYDFTKSIRYGFDTVQTNIDAERQFVNSCNNINSGAAGL